MSLPSPVPSDDMPAPVIFAGQQEIDIEDDEDEEEDADVFQLPPAMPVETPAVPAVSAAAAVAPPPKPRPELPDSILGTIFNHLDFSSAKNASLCSRAFAKASRARMFRSINLASPGPAKLHAAGVTLPDRLSQYMMGVDMATFEHLQQATIKVDYGVASDALLKSCYKWWTSILNLTTALQSFDLEVVLPAADLPANTTAEQAYKAKDDILRSLMTYLVKMPSAPTLHTVKISMQDRNGSRLDWIHVLEVLAASDYFGSINTLRLPYLRDPTTAHMATVLNGINTFSPTTLSLMRARYLPTTFPDITCDVSNLEYYVFGDDTDEGSPMLDELTLLLALFPSITDLKIAESSKANLSLSSLPALMPVLQTLTYEGRYASTFLANLAAPNLHKISVKVPNLHPEFFSPILQNGTLPSLKYIVFEGVYDGMNESWLADWSCLSELAEFVGVELELKMYFKEPNPWEAGSPMMTSILHWTARDLVHVATSNLWPCSVNPDRPELIHFSKLTHGRFVVDGGCEASTPSLHWLLVWMAGVTAPKLRKVILQIENAPGADILLELAVVFASKINFPALNKVQFQVELEHSAKHWDEGTGGTGYADYLTWIEKRVKQLVGNDMNASVVFGPLQIEQEDDD